jgi:hypothetical protein
MTNNRLIQVFAVCLLTTTTMLSHAESDTTKKSSTSVSTITPIFSQLLMSSQPNGFITVSEQSNATRYIREAVLKGETIDSWTQMITTTGAKNISSNPSATPRGFAAEIVSGYQQACASTFNVRVLSEEKINGYDAIAVVVGCGRSPLTAGKTSEAALIVTIKGEKDYYTIQWAKREEPSDKPFQIDVSKWTDSLKSLMPIRLCTKKPGEAAPYPSCLGK